MIFARCDRIYLVDLKIGEICTRGLDKMSFNLNQQMCIEFRTVYMETVNVCMFYLIEITTCAIPSFLCLKQAHTLILLNIAKLENHI